VAGAPGASGGIAFDALGGAVNSSRSGSRCGPTPAARPTRTTSTRP
jgi:hypothetical protein